MKAILLARVSSESQQLDEQTNNLITYALSDGYKRDNLIIIEDKESAIKLSEDERNGLNRMKECISNDSSINCVYVWELTRLTRIPTTGYSLREYFLKNNIQLKNYSPSFQLLNNELSDYDENGSMLFAIYMNFAEQEMRTKKARFKRSKIRNARTGKYSGGVRKFGYDIDSSGYYQINEKEAELIRYTFDRYEAGISKMKLNKELLQRGMIDSACFVTETLKCEAYTGLSNKYKMNRVYPQIISKEQFDRCKAIARKNNKRLDKANEIYFGKGIIRCTECGATFLAMKTSVQYLCYNRFGREQKLDKTKACRTSASININILDTILFQACITEETYYLINNSENKIDELKNKIRFNEEKIEALQSKINKTDTKKERNNTMFLNGGVNEERYLANLRAIEAEIKDLNNSVVGYTNLNQKLQKTIKELTTEKKEFYKEYVKNEKNVYDVDDLIEKQKIVQRHIEKVTIEDEIPNLTKLVNIYFYRYPNLPLQYKVYHKAKPQQIEINEAFYADGYDETFKADWVNCNFKIEKRFVRK